MAIVVGQAPLLKSVFTPSFWGEKSTFREAVSDGQRNFPGGSYALQTIGSKQPKPFGFARRDLYDLSVLQRTILDDGESQEGMFKEENPA